MAEVIAADALVGEPVVNTRGEALGAVEDVMIDVQRGAVAYTLVGLGETLLTVPWSALTHDAARRCFVLEGEPERYARAAEASGLQGPAGPFEM